MEMLAAYFAISDNLKAFRTKLKKKGKRKVIVIRSDSKSTMEQLNKRSEVRDDIKSIQFDSKNSGKNIVHPSI